MNREIEILRALTVAANSLRYNASIDPDTANTYERLLMSLRDDLVSNSLVKLPCKVGDTVYAAEAAPALPLSVVYFGAYLEGESGGDWECIQNWGKTIFPTREDAEAALMTERTSTRAIVSGG